MASNFINFIDCAALKIYALPEMTIEVTNGTITKTLSINDVSEITSLYALYTIYIPTKNFGTWTISSIFNNNIKTKTIIINNFQLYTVSVLLPEDYQQLEYITFPSGAYINTNVYANSAVDGIYTELKLTEDAYGSDRHYIGVDASDGAAYHVTSYNNAFCYGYKDYNNTFGEFSNAAWIAGEKIIKYNNKQTNILLDVNNNKYTESYLAPDSNLPILIGRRSSAANFVGKIYYCLMKNNTTLQYERKLYPAKRISDSVLGLYDIINDIFYTNAGSGTFIAGPSVDKSNKPFFIYQSGFGAKVPLSYANESNSSINIDNFNITTNYNGDHYQILCFNTNPIDTTKYDQLVVKSIITTAKTDSTTYDGRIFLANIQPPLSSVSNTHASANIIRSTRINTGTEIQTTVLDLDDVTTTGYVGLKGGMIGTISQIYLI